MREQPGLALRRRIASHPLVTVGVLASLSAALSAAWIWRTRHLGALDPDEAGYLATALRIDRHLGPNLDLFRDAFGTDQAPLVPLLSVPFTLIGGRDPRVAMMIQPVLVVVAALGVTGITRRIASDGAAILAGLASACLPTVLLASQAYWFGLAAAAFSTVALWSLLRSERLDNPWRFAFGAAIGLMLLSRTMSLALVPAFVGAALVQVWGSRRRTLRLLEALSVAVLVAGPWFVARRDGIFGYLVQYGYGDRARYWGSGNPVERLWFRLGRFADGFGFPGPLVVVFLALLGAALFLTVRGLPRGRPWPTITRDWASVAVVASLGTMALVTTTNQGEWFELPTILVLVVLIAAGIDRAPNRLRTIAGVAVVVLSIGWPTSLRAVGVTHLRWTLVDHDDRFDDPERAREAADEWWQLTEHVTAALARPRASGSGGQPAYLAGNTFLFNTNTLLLAGELDGWSPDIEVPDTLAGAAEQEKLLGPRTSSDSERLLLIARHDHALFTPDLQVEQFRRRALADGWSPVRTWPMPGVGTVELLRRRPGV